MTMIIPVEQEGPRLFARYAFVCTEGKVREKKLTEKNAELLRHLIKNGGGIPVAFLEKCFPIPVGYLISFAKYRGLRPWDLKTVRTYWQEFHTHEEGRDIKNVTIVSVIATARVRIVKYRLGSDTEDFNAINLYELDLREGIRVFLHKDFVVEIDSK